MRAGWIILLASCAARVTANCERVARRALARGQRIHLVCHEDVLVFHKPDAAEPARIETAAATGRAAA